jgi:hypothetical protein
MPIRLNLLAEAQAAEEMRRRDPVKRTIWVGAILVSLMLAWSSSLQVKTMMAANEAGRLEAQMNSNSNSYKSVLDDLKKKDELQGKVLALYQLSSNRFLQGNLLNALQQTNSDDVQLLHLKLDQSYAVVEATKPRTNENNRVIAGRPGTATERIVLMLDGFDSSANPGDQVTTYKRAVANHPYFRSLLGKTNDVNLKNLSPPELMPIAGTVGKPCVLFTLECRMQEKTRVQ